MGQTCPCGSFAPCQTMWSQLPYHLAREMFPMIWLRKSYIQTGAKMPRFTQSGFSTVGFLWIADLDSTMIEWHEGHSVSPLAQASSHVVQDAPYRSDTFSVYRIWHTPKWFTLRCPVSKNPTSFPSFGAQNHWKKTFDLKNYRNIIHIIFLREKSDALDLSPHPKKQSLPPGWHINIFRLGNPYS